MKLSVDEEPFALLWQYWNKVRAGRIVPGSRKFDFTQLAAVVPEMSVLDIIGPDKMQYRMTGSDLVARFGGELTGVNLYDIFSEKTRSMLSQSLLHIVTQPCAGLCETSITYQSGRQATVRLLAVPVQIPEEIPGRVVLVQKIDYGQGVLANETVSVIGAEFFTTRFIDLGAGGAGEAGGGGEAGEADKAKPAPCVVGC